MLACVPLVGCFGGANPAWLAPCALVARPGSSLVYGAGARGGVVVVLDLEAGRIESQFAIAGRPTGLAWADAPRRLVVTVSGPVDAVAVYAPDDGQGIATWPAGHGVCSPVFSRAKKRLYTCNRFDNEVCAYDLSTGRKVSCIATLRQPIAAALSPDERVLVVARHLPEGTANALVVAAGVTLIDTESERVRAQVRLPSGSTGLQGLAISPDGKWCAVPHNLGRFQVPTVQVEYGWMNASALSLIALEDSRLVGTLLLDEPRRGAANPWAAGWSPDGAVLGLTHAGTHEISLIAMAELSRRLADQAQGELIGDLEFLRGIRTRVALPGNGPRALAMAGQKAYVAEFFSDTVRAIDLPTRSVVASFSLGPGAGSTEASRGEQLFHDATIGHQGWQSCASCHPEGRADGLNWDLVNDGLGNPKNTKSLLLSHQTPPAMSSGVRATAEEAVRSGLRHILFAAPSERNARAIETYLSGLRPMPSPHLIEGDLSPSARRGKALFEDAEVGCSGCHPAPLFSDLKLHDVGTGRARRSGGLRLDTPTLIESWRTGPYLHDGSAVTLIEVLTSGNPNDGHGKTSHLTPGAMEDLSAYVLSL
ncbi:MAG: hypothetical protein FJ387_19300 [Verrucomicrobia bacterium]|nr:hypothetical protein [Verrucomicrobiota bacterium]